MAVGAYFHPESMSTQQYDACIKALEQAGAGKPKGRLYHACFGEPGKLMVFDVWDSMESFEKFGETMLPIVTAQGVNPGQPQVMPIHNMIIG